MTAGRLYVVQSWNNASAYSGEQIGSRLAQSKALHFNLDGTANLTLYDDEQWQQEKTAKRRQKTPQEILLPHSASLNRFDVLEAQVNQQFDNGEIDQSQYADLIHALYLQRAIAFKKHLQSMGLYEHWLDERQRQKDEEQQALLLEQQRQEQEARQWTSYELSNAELLGLFTLAIVLICFTVYP